MSALFACTRCAKRYPFEELSDAEQLCKECRNNFPTVKCTYCRSEFQQSDKNGVSAICKKCAHNVKAYGKPRACEYCNIIAAFIGKRCQRCANSEHRWGPPKTCEQCKQTCAFDRGSDTAKRIKGKLLCWLCTMAYKRAIAKSLKAKEFTKSVSDQTRKKKEEASGSAGQSTEDDAPYSPGSGYPTNESQDSTPYSPGLGFMLGTDDKDSLQGTPGGKSETPGSSSSKHASRDSKDFSSRSSLTSLKHKALDNVMDKGSDSKKMKLEKASNGFSSLIKSQSMSEFGNGSESMIMMTQLRGQLESTKRQLQEKDKQLFERDKKITELKAHHVAQESKLRKKMEGIQTQSQQIIDDLKSKNRELTQQISKLSKPGKKS